MGVVTDSVRAGRGALAYPRVDLADCPVDFLKAQHTFLRDVAAALDALVGGEKDARARTLYDVLCAELGRTLQDRRANLLPVLARRADPEDEVDQMVAVESSVLIPLMRVRLATSDYDLLTAAFRARRETLANLPVEAG